MLGLGSPTYPLPEESYAAWTSTYAGKSIFGREYLYSGPLFTHQLSHLWIGFRVIQDAFMSDRGIDYFENSRQATYVHQQYAIRKLLEFEGYNELCWGLTASDGPGSTVRKVKGIERHFFDYIARGAPYGPDDGTISPWVVVASLPFATEIVLPSLFSGPSPVRGERGTLTSMSEHRPSYGDLLEAVQRLQRQVEALLAENARLRADLDAARRAGKRQAAPFRKGPPAARHQRPGRKAGDRHGPHAHRPAPPPDRITEVLDAPLPDACPARGGAVAATDIAHQYQTELPRQPIRRRFDVHRGQCRQCARRVQGRHPLQTSDALGAAARRLGPDARAAIVTLNKDAGLSHGKVAACLAALVGIDLTRGASAHVVLRDADRLQPAYDEIRQATRTAGRLAVDETGWRVGGQPAWLHAWVSDRATCYGVDRWRGAGALGRVVGRDRAGVLVHDGLASYDRFTGAAHQQCVAHLLRRAREMLKAATRGAVRFPRQVIELFTGAVHLRNEHLAGRVPAAVWEAARDEYDLRLLPLLRGRRAGANQALSNHLGNHFASWFTFLADPAVPATSWQAEQAIRPAVVNRKVWGGNLSWLLEVARVHAT